MRASDAGPRSAIVSAGRFASKARPTFASFGDDQPSGTARACTGEVSGTLAGTFDGGAASARRRLLVVDDSITTRALVKSILQSAGYDVIAASDGLQAWRLLQDAPVDLVVSDVEMPGMDGFALTAAIRGSRRLREMPVILVTALESAQDRLRGMDAGADAYLEKSAFDQTALIRAIERLT